MKKSTFKKTFLFLKIHRFLKILIVWKMEIDKVEMQ